MDISSDADINYPHHHDADISYLTRIFFFDADIDADIDVGADTVRIKISAAEISRCGIFQTWIFQTRIFIQTRI